jgi:hypothetical protein
MKTMVQEVRITTKRWPEGHGSVSSEWGMGMARRAG